MRKSLFSPFICLAFSVCTPPVFGQETDTTAEAPTANADPLRERIVGLLQKAEYGTQSIVAAAVMATGRPSRVIEVLESPDLYVFRDGEEAGAIALVRLKSKLGFD